MDITDSIDNHVDDHVDEEIKSCFTNGNHKSFFMFAGAGSGKTRSLVNALSFLEKEKGEQFALRALKIAVITYTNAASDEIERRLHNNPIFAISTIHSFLWKLIKHYQSDIKDWIKKSIEADIDELKEKQSKGRKGSDAERKRSDEIKRKTDRLNKLAKIKRFSYDPNGNNESRDSLNHEEVIKMASEFIRTEDAMQEILVRKFPILLIDESQDTKSALVDALLPGVYEKYKDSFVIGMFGDTMQKIYMDGKANLSVCIPDDWEKPIKVMNHRSQKRIVDLANAIRKTLDGIEQRPRTDKSGGTIRLFIANSGSKKDEVEKLVAQKMSDITKDEKWLDNDEYKSLILEHHMAASRFGFSKLYEPLNTSGEFDTSLRNGSISELSLLYEIVLPLVQAKIAGNDFEVSKILRKYSPLMSKKTFSVTTGDQTVLLRTAETAVDDLVSLWNNGVPSCIDVLKSIHKTNLFEMNARVEKIISNVELTDEDVKESALREALAVSFDELTKYGDYISEKTQFATHQGIKGLEFPRVMVIMDDAEAKGFLFSYEKLFGAKDLTSTDLKNEQEGKDTTVNRTSRLFYVACTRAEESLAVVAYTENTEAVKKTAIDNCWFMDNEIEVL
jgi:DNA helicase-2/ATP-dependent DNA helicase PcrA